MKTNHAFYCLIMAFLATGCRNDDPGITPKMSTFIDSRDNHSYQTVLIGSQKWMAENLAYLPAVYPHDSLSLTKSRYYVYDFEGTSTVTAKNDSYYHLYGVLYNWVAAKSACPVGWHLPSDNEWKTLGITLGMTKKDVDSTGFSLNQTVGKALKSVIGWSLNGNGTNASGFTAFPGGCLTKWGYFYEKGLRATFWTATGEGASDAWERELLADYGSLYRYHFAASYGMSVRCVENSQSDIIEPY